MAFTRKPMTPYPVYINGQSVKYAQTHRFLGIIIDRSLSWSPHCAYLKKRLLSIVHIMKLMCGKAWGTSVASMLQLYRALFLGLLRYSLPVLTNTCKSNSHSLESLQGQALRICLELPRCASTYATIMLAKDHPVRTYRVVDCLRAHIRHASRVPDHHLALLPSGRPRATLSDVIAKHLNSIPSGYTPATRMACPLWCLDQPQARLEIPGIKKKSNHSRVALKQTTLLLLHKLYLGRTQIYTDGSVLSSSSSGAAVIPAAAMTIKFKLSHMTTSTASELAAIRAALQYLVQERPGKWVIFCDSKAALQSLQSAMRRRSHEQLVQKIRHCHHEALARGHDVIYQWLPGHIGITGNQLADDAARSAHEGTRVVPIPLSRNDAARQLYLLARDLRRTFWSSASFQRCQFYELDPSLKIKLPSQLSRSDATLLCRLWLGVAFTKVYSFRIGMADTSTCDYCGAEETIEHVLCSCACYDTQRCQLRMVLNQLTLGICLSCAESD
uniref:ribonuclease H n=1 Tax=Rhipicephalus microplus TaxID=6941 RepID=A0A6M2CZP6_RHIMP